MLRELHHLLRCIWGKFRERIKMKVRHDEKVPRGVGISIKADEAMSAAMDDVSRPFGVFLPHSLCNGIVGRCDHVAEDTVFVFGGGPVGESRRNTGAGLCVRAGDVAIAPGGPETIHISASIEAEPEEEAGE